MKKLLLTLIAAGCTLIASARDLRTMVLTPTPRMTCSGCENRIKGHLKFEKGIKAIKTDLTAQTITITYDADANTADKLMAAFGKIGYTVTLVSADKAATPAP